VREASQALPTLTDPVRRADLSWVLARAHVGAGSNEDAIAVMRGAVASGGLPRAWEARMLAWLAIMEREHTGDLDASDATAYEALALAREGADGFATSVALTSLWLSHSVRRDHAAALGYIDQALQVVSDDPGHAEWRYGAFGNRIFTLENLDRWPEAELTLRQAREFAQRSGIPDRSTWVNAAVLRYWLGQWSDALAELGPEETDGSGLMFPFLREHWPALLAYGVAALIAGRRDDRAEAARQLRLGQNLPVQTDIVAGENQDFLMAAQAVTLEQGGEIRGAMNVLARFLPRRDGAMTLIHQWLPDLVRLAVSVGDTELAQAAVQACDAEAAAETQSARAAAASLRCRGLLGSDPAPLRDAVAYYRAAGPVVDLPVALEDLAAVLAERGEGDEAKVTLNEAVRLYESLGAHWDIRRADVRLRQHGVRRGAGSRRRRRPATGWDALTPTEVKIAAMIAGGDSTSDIAKGMSLSRRTVQTYISRILAKLDAKGRVDIAREALSHAASL
jgi:DNA-binding CsgD family transcriptional regulator